MSELSIRVGDLHFSARWEPEAPQTIEVIRAMLPAARPLIHCRWSGESTWIPYGDLRPDVGWEHHTSHPAPGHLALYPGGISECEIFFPYGVVHDVVEGRPAGREPLRDGPPRRGLGGAAARGRPAVPLGRRPGDRDHRALTVADLVVRGGTVVTATGSRVADVAVEGGRITAIEPDLSGPASTAREVVDASGLLVLPGRRRRPHPHAGRLGRGAGPVLPGLGGGGVRRDDDVPLVQQPGDRLVARRRRGRSRSGCASGRRRRPPTPRSMSG